MRDYRAATFLQPYYEARKRKTGHAGRLLNLLVYLGFQAWLPIRARRVARRWNESAEWVGRTVAICRARIVDPNDIALFRIREEAELDHYMRRFEHIGVGRAIAHRETDHAPLLLDKARFYSLCRTEGIAHPHVLATCNRGDAGVLAVPRPGQKLFVKPARGSGGVGAHTITFEPEADPAIEFQRLIAALSGKDHGNWIVQPRLKPHPAIADIAGSALPTVRVVTLLDERGEPEIVSTVLRLAADDGTVVDNIGVGGLSAPVEAESGVLGAACGGMRPGEFACHPVSGAAIEGRVLPDSAQIRSLALTTHARHFRDHVMIGWDVAVAEGGPCLLEGNPRPSIILTQRAARIPVGRTRMGVLIRHHLEQRLGDDLRRPRLLFG